MYKFVKFFIEKKYVDFIVLFVLDVDGDEDLFGFLVRYYFSYDINE